MILMHISWSLLWILLIFSRTCSLRRLSGGVLQRAIWLDESIFYCFKNEILPLKNTHHRWMINIPFRARDQWGTYFTNRNLCKCLSNNNWFNILHWVWRAIIDTAKMFLLHTSATNLSTCSQELQHINIQNTLWSKTYHIVFLLFAIYLVEFFVL